MISVIIPVFNVDMYLRECINSILNQSYTDLEIILVDDGSTDKSGAICEEYAAMDSRIIVVHIENGGVSRARNTGLGMAKGEYIGFVDSDDLIHPKMYEHLLNAIIDYDADIASCSHSLFLDGDMVVEKGTAKEAYVLDKVENREQYLNNFLSGSFTHYVWKSLYKRNIFESIRFEEGKRMEDVMFCGRLSSIISKRVVIKNRLYYYRIQGNSIMHANSHIFLEHIDAMEYNINHFEKCENDFFVQKYVEFVMSHILTTRVTNRVCGSYDAYVDAESLKSFRKLYSKYGSSRKSHLLANYFPWVYNVLKAPKVRKHLEQAKKAGVPIDFN